MSDAGLAPVDPEALKRFEEVTGCWGMLIHEVGRRCAGRERDWQSILSTFEVALQSQQEWWEAFGLTHDAMPVLQAMAVVDDPVTPTDLYGILDKESIETAEKVLDWADLLGFVRQVGEGKVELDRLVGQVTMKLSER
jgi:hypothetical protein